MTSGEVFLAVWLSMAASTVIWGVVQIRMAEILLGHGRLKPEDWAAGIFLAAVLWPLMAAGLVCDAVLFYRDLKELREREQSRLRRDASGGRGHLAKGPCACGSCR